jgi:hypothetical protein
MINSNLIKNNHLDNLILNNFKMYLMILVTAHNSLKRKISLFIKINKNSKIIIILLKIQKVQVIKIWKNNIKKVIIIMLEKIKIKWIKKDDK